MTVGNSICVLCSRIEARSGSFDGVATGVCAAFPDGIPVDIFAGGFDHRESFAGETILFLPLDDVTDDEIENALHAFD